MTLVRALLLASLLSGCAAPSHRSDSAHELPELEVVQRYHAALNRRDLLALTAYVTPDLEWYSVIDGERRLEVTGREALAAQLRQYFAQTSQSTWDVESATQVGTAIAVRERSRWLDSAPGERVTLCVYEFRDGRIRRITRFL